MQKHESLDDIQLLASDKEMASDVIHFFSQAITAESNNKMLVRDFLPTKFLTALINRNKQNGTLCRAHMQARTGFEETSCLYHTMRETT